MITFIDIVNGRQEYKNLLVQVKGGHLSAPQTRDFRGTIQVPNVVGYAKNAPIATAVPEQATLTGMPVPVMPPKRRK